MGYIFGEAQTTLLKTLTGSKNIDDYFFKRIVCYHENTSNAIFISTIKIKIIDTSPKNLFERSAEKRYHNSRTIFNSLSL